MFESSRMLATIKKDKKVGIMIRAGHLFSNGMVQNAYFLHQCFESIGYRCQFLSIEKDPAPFGHKDLSVQHLSTDPTRFNPNQYHTILTVGIGLNKEEYDMFKRANVGIVGFVCGNNYMMDQEDFVRGARGTVSFLGKQLVDELWVIPSYHHSIDYLETLRKKPAFLVPHLWSSEIIRVYAPRSIKQEETALFYSLEKRTSPKINLLICEPNQYLFKTAWMPIIAAERLHMDHPDLFEFVYAFNYPEHPHAWTMGDALSLGPKLRRFKRLAIPEILHHFNHSSGSMPIFVSHQVLNSLNYLYYEVLYYGFPLVHNSPDLEGCGYYFPENDIKACAAQILYAQKHHDKGIETYKAKAREYLKRVDPLDTIVQRTFEQYLTASIVKNCR